MILILKMRILPKKGSKDRRAIYLYFIILCIVVAFWVLRDKLHIPSEIFQLPGMGTLKGTVRCTLISPVGNSRYLRMGLAIPYKDRSQWRDIRKAVPRLKHDFMLSMEGSGLETVVQKRDFETLRAHLLRLLNRHVKRPVEQLYFESFFLD